MGHRPQDAELLTLLSTDLTRDRDESRVVQTIFDHVPLVLPGAQHIGISIDATRGRARSSSSSSFAARKADALQQRLHEGPGLDVISRQSPGWLVSGDVAVDPRWTRWGPATAGLGLRAMTCVLLRDEGETYGALTMYGEAPHAFRDDDLDGTVRWARQAANALATARLVAELQRAADAARVLGAAQGVVMARLGCDQASAARFLGRLAADRSEDLAEVAGRLLATRTVPSLREPP